MQLGIIPYYMLLGTGLLGFCAGRKCIGLLGVGVQDFWLSGLEFRVYGCWAFGVSGSRVWVFNAAPILNGPYKIIVERQ